MSTRALLLLLSLVANAALVAAYLSAPAAAHPTQPPAGAATPARLAEPDAAAKASATRSVPAAFSWAAIDTPDIDELARRLKAAGFTSEEVRAILGRRIGQVFGSSPAGAAAKPTPYWRTTGGPIGQVAEEQRKQMAERMRLYQKYLMSPDNLDNPDQIESAKRRWGDLPVDKLQAIARIEADYQELSMKQYAERSIRPGEEGNGTDARRLIEQERLADIAKVLTPEEFAAWEIRASPTAIRLRFQLDTFKPSEDEYKAIFAINKAYEARLFDPQLSPDARTALANEVTAKVSELLGPDRALDYDAAINQNSRDQTAGLVSRLGLPARVATEVRQTQQDITQRAKDIRANAALSASERDSQLAALHRQAETQLTAKLGTDGFEAYNDLKGEWIRALQPK